ncbi:MAG: folate-binding protein YgfZ [Actinomycetales bacterium]|nr:folate-binding protein YgfZ [Actinomycetales bacterium]
MTDHSAGHGSDSTSSPAAVSPFAARPGAVGDPPQHYGEPVAEQRALLAGRAVVDLGARGVVAVTGPDRLSWLDSLTSQSIAALEPGGSAETLLLDPSGRIEHAIRVLDDGATSWLLVDDRARAAALTGFLDRMRFLLRVEVRDASEEFATIGTLGDPPAAAAAPAGVPLVWRDPWRELAPGGWQYADAAEHPGPSWTWLETLVERDRLAELAETPAAGTLAFNALRIAAWRPSTAELDATTLPHELDWLRSAVHLSKGCYRGQETVAKVHNLGHPPRRLALLHLDGSPNVLPAPGDEVRLGGAGGEAATDGAAIGRITSAARHHELGPIALAVLKRGADPAATLVVAATDGEGGTVAVAAAQEVIVPPAAGAVAEVPRLPRLGAVRR